MAVEVFIHKMSDHMETAQILKWHVREGDRVERSQVILEVMTDKVTAELEAPEAGIIKSVRPGAVEGVEIPVGEAICYIAAPDEQVPALPPLPGFTPQETEAGARVPIEAAAPAQPQEEVAGARASPVARKVARELGIDLNKVQGTGPLGRISEADVRAFASAPAAARGIAAPHSVTAAPASTAAIPPEPGAITPAPVSVSSAAQGATGTTLSLSSIQRLTGERMRASVVNAPQFSIDVLVDMTQALWLRQELTDRVTVEAGVGPSVTGLLVKVVAAALRRHPRANSEFAGDHLRVHEDINIGVAVGTDGGLVVPVVRNADRRSLVDITRELARYQEQAETLRFSAEDLTGGTFTISNLGMYGVDGFRAIVNPPQSAILAVGRIRQTPAGLSDGMISLRPLMSLTLTVDHRSLDGLQAARLLTEIRDLLERPHLLLA